MVAQGSRFEHLLVHLELGYDVEGDAHDEAERAERDDRSVEVLVRAGEVHERAVSADEVESSDRGGERSVTGAGAVRRGGDRSADGDVRQRRVVRDCQPVPRKRAAELAVTDAGFHGDGPLADLDDLIEVLGGEQHAGRVCDATERMARPEGSETVRLRNHRLRFGDRVRRENAIGRVRQVAGPVLHGLGRIAAAARASVTVSAAVLLRAAGRGRRGRLVFAF